MSGYRVLALLTLFISMCGSGVTCMGGVASGQAENTTLPAALVFLAGCLFAGWLYNQGNGGKK